MANQVPIKLTTSRLPVFFISHGGPNIMFETEGDLKPTVDYLADLGRRITRDLRPRNILVISAHWQAPGQGVQVNSDEKTKLIYDYYGFPSHYYDVVFDNRGDKRLADRVVEVLKKASIPATQTTRGLDHGAFAPFKVMFPPSNPLEVPVVQMSLSSHEDAKLHMEIGKALAPLREEGTLIIGSGHSVHNLGEMWTYMNKNPPSYVGEFTKDLESCVTKNTSAERETAMTTTLVNHPLLRKAHPTLEHLLPLYVATGAAGHDKGVVAFSFIMSSLTFGMYEFGVQASA